MEYFLSILDFLLAQSLPDGGSFYAETQPDHWLVEPWNAFSSLTFWLPVFYWGGKLWGRYQHYLFLVGCMPLLFVGGMGSALFHAFRVSPWLLWMDVLPILLLTAALSIYLWAKVIGRFDTAFLLFGLYFGFQLFIWFSAQLPGLINFSYFLRGVMMFLPAALLMRRVGLRLLKPFIYALLFFGLALCFRSLDFAFQTWLPMGSHWLWHVATAIGAHFLARFLYDFANWERVVQRAKGN